MHGEAAVAPRAIAQVTGGDHVVECPALALGALELLARRAIHSGQPPLRYDFGFGDVREIDDAQDVIGEALEMR